MAFSPLKYLFFLSIIAVIFAFGANLSEASYGTNSYTILCYEGSVCSCAQDYIITGLGHDGQNPAGLNQITCSRIYNDQGKITYWANPNGSWYKTWFPQYSNWTGQCDKGDFMYALNFGSYIPTGIYCYSLVSSSGKIMDGGNTSVIHYGYAGTKTDCPTNYQMSFGLGDTFRPDGATDTLWCKQSCAETSWTPDPSAYCSGSTITQTSNCGTTRTTTGSKTCSIKADIQANNSNGPITINSGDKVTLLWKSDGQDCQASGGFGWTGYKSPYCTFSFGFGEAIPRYCSEQTSPITSSATFVLSCKDQKSGAYQTDSVAVNVPVPPSPPTLDLKINGSDGPIDIAYNSSAGLIWTSNNTTSCTASGAWSGSKALSGNESTGNLTSAKTYTLTCSGPGGSKSDSATVNVLPPSPSLTFSSSPNPIDYNTASTLTWTSENTTLCTASGDWFGNKVLFGNESTGNLTSAKTYTLTCSGPGGSIDKSVMVGVNAETVTHNVSGWIWSENIGWISVSCNNQGVCATTDYGVSLNETTGQFRGYGWSENIGWVDFYPLSGYPLDPQTGAILNIITKKVTGWIKALAGDTVLNDGWDGWASTAGNNYGVTWQSCDLIGWAWGSDVLGWLSFSSQNCDPDKDGKSNGVSGCPVAGTTMAQYGVKLSTCVNTSPVADSLTTSQSDSLYCSIGLNATFNWNFTDADGDIQSAYQIQIDDNSDFSSLIKDTGKINSASNSYAITGTLQYNTAYFWRIKVWDSKDSASNWAQGSSFTTKVHQYPSVDFIWSPSQPTEIQKVNFTDKTIFYDGAGDTSHSWQWAFTGGNPANSNVQNPANIQFNIPGSKSVNLTATDKDNYSCNLTKNLNVKKSVKWKEIAP